MLYLLKAIQYFIFLYSLYFLFFAAAGLFTRRCRREHPPRLRFAVVIPAHNEEKVIGHLVDSLLALHYPRQLFDIFVVADNCTDNTAAVARRRGAVVWERFDRERRGKGYALEFALRRLGFTGGERKAPYDALVVFDADNLVAPNYLQAMNNRLLAGEKIVQCFIDAKNPNDSWVASVFSLTFWVNNRFILQARYNLGLSAALAGTGMCISREVLYDVGWRTVTLTEDLEFSMQALLKGYRTCFAVETRIYDEKPLRFITSCRQRLRWARGQINVAFLYGPRLLLRGLGEFNLQKMEAGVRLLQLFVIAAGGVLTLLALYDPHLVMATSPLYALGSSFPPVKLALPLIPYALPVLAALIDRLPAKPFRYFLLFYPLFTYSWILLIILAFFTCRNRRWMPTEHTRSIDHRSLLSSKT